MLSVNSNFSNPVVLPKKQNTVQNADVPVEQNNKSAGLPAGYYPPVFKGKVPDKLISEGNIKQTIEKLDILNDSKGLDKLIEQYKNDMDKCCLAQSYEEYRNSVKLVEHKWQGLVDKINGECASEDINIASKAGQIFEEKFIPALLHFQEVFSKMDNTEMVRKGYAEELKASKNI